jgi:acetyltransferase-like isoleucine patch superfamily enzyme
MLTEEPRIPIGSILLYGLWPGFIKKLLYRLKGYRIGKGVRIGLGAVICGDEVEVGDYTSIGFLSIVRGKHIRLGAHVRIGSLTFLDTPHLEIGEGTIIREQVFVGGLQFPDSKLSIGSNCSIMQLTFINPARPIVIGDGCAIGGHCLIFSHSSSLNQFDGYPVEFAPIEIGNNVGLAWRSFVLPGVRIGDGTMVGANSLVSGSLPSSAMAVGYPARVVGRPPVFPKKVCDEEKLSLFRKIVAEMIRFLTDSGFVCEKDGEYYEIKNSRRGWRRVRKWRIRIIEATGTDPIMDCKSAPPDVLLSLWEIPPDIRRLLDSQNVVWIDIVSKAQSEHSNSLGDEVIGFFRRYGVRPVRDRQMKGHFDRTAANPQ